MEQSITSKRNLPKKIDTSSLNQEKKSFHSENEVLHVYSLINQGKVPRYVDFSPAFLDVFPKNTFKTSIHPGLVPPHGEVCAATFSPSYVHPSKSEKETFTTSLQHPTTTNTTDFGGHPALFPSSSSSTDTWSSWNTRSFQEPRTPHSSLADLISLQDQEELMRTKYTHLLLSFNEACWF
ncbi:hypothetical protein HMI54_002902 [Coelomomyces lativittatus]|nr:hypothetical protein HMI55_004550 [Coelomomyces lativittatus]KAJ1518041.1 hypothetical protein HMI54_002902 [Coelomomyces lativittatus]